MPIFITLFHFTGRKVIIAKEARYRLSKFYPFAVNILYIRVTEIGLDTILKKHSSFNSACIRDQ